jgi:hypothetical protein
VGEVAPRSYNVEVEGGKVYRRNRIHIRDSLQRPLEHMTPEEESQPAPPEHRELQQSSPSMPEPITMTPQATSGAVATNLSPETYVTRSGRSVNPPSRLDV